VISMVVEAIVPAGASSIVVPGAAVSTVQE
jgi:hypothetical protein